ncbi:MAG: glycosyltransferase family 4 protein [Actinobacteria bacterium]|nr:glycosyltransferase family 4 protein [Actinomycetota bacterium]MCL5883594.1 glycosyltransferase family 4 protein [Actinomycetota bacterium]
MKIALVTEYYYPLLGGITEHVHNLAGALSRKGHEVTVVTHNLKPRKHHHYPDDPLNFTVERFGKGIPIYSNGSFARVTLGKSLGDNLGKFFEREQFDVIHAHSPLTPILPLLAVRRSKAPVTVGTFHTYFDRSHGYGLLKKKFMESMNMMDGKIVVSDACVEALSRYFDTDYKVIPNGVDTSYFRPEAPQLPQFDDDKLNILFVGRFDPRNGLKTMLNAFRIVKSQFDNCRLIVVGDGPLRPYYRTLVDRRLSKDIHFAGLVNGGRPNFYSTADIYCTPCTKASFGVVLLEAMASATPIVASDINGYRLVMEDNKQGILVPETAAAGFAEALMRLLKDPELRQRMGREGRKTAEEAFSWDLVASRVEQYYLELMGRKLDVFKEDPAPEKIFALND